MLDNSSDLIIISVPFLLDWFKETKTNENTMSDISSADLDYIESVFEQIDINNDGTITLSELASSKINL